MAAAVRTAVRNPAVAGLFYPGDPATLRSQVRQMLAAARAASSAATRQPAANAAPDPPSALIVPHAGYRYSGPVAAMAFARIGDWQGRAARVVLVGPAHHVAFDGLAGSAASAFATPAGDVPVSPLPPGLAAELDIRSHDAAHEPEHSLEMQLPFLLAVLGPVPIVPLLTGRVEGTVVADALLRLWDADTLVVVSSDLSHYLPYHVARRRDAATAAAIERLDAQAIGPRDACGHTAVQALLLAARRRRLAAQTLDLRNSGDASGHRGEVVGYGAFLFTATDSTGGKAARNHGEVP